MAANTYNYAGQNSSSQRAVAMGLALVSAIVLSPLYMTIKNDHHYHHHTIFHNETKYWNSGFVLPMVLAVLIIAIKTTTSSSSMERVSVFPSPDPSWVLRIGSSSWGLAGILVMLVLVLSWQDSVQHFFWRWDISQNENTTYNICCS